MAGKNPFVRAIETRKDEPAEEAAEAARRTLGRTELKQTSADSDRGHADDTPSEVEDNADNAEQEAGAEFGLGGATGFVSARDRMSEKGDDSSGDAAPDVAEAPDERIAAGTGVPQFNIDGVSTQDALSAASGADNTDVAEDLTDFNPRKFVEDAKAARNPLNDPLIAADMAMIDDAANDAETDPYSVAVGGTIIRGAVAAGRGARTLIDDAASTIDDAVRTIPDGAPVVDDAAKTSLDNLPVGAPAIGGGTTRTPGAVGAALEGAERGFAIVDPISMGITTVVSAVGSINVAGGQTIDLAVGAGEDSKQETERKAEKARKEGEERKRQREEEERKKKEEEERKQKEEEEAKKKEEENDKEQGAKPKTTPDDDMRPPTPEEIAFAQAAKNALGIRRIPGDIDPNEGDGTQTSGPVDATLAAGIVNQKTNESLVGNPGALESGNAPAPSTGQGSPGIGGLGGDVDFEDGRLFGNQRSTSPNDVDFSVGNQPLLGLEGNQDDEDDDDEDDDDEEEDSDSSG